MRARAGLFVLGLTTAASVLPGAALAQTYVAQPQYYLLTTDAFDGRSLWVQPAALARLKEASISLMVTGDHLNGPLLLSQYGATLSSGGLGLGWQHDEDPTSAGHTDAFVVGFGFGSPTASLGGDRRWHRGTNTKDAAWDFGGRYNPTGGLELSLTWRDVGQPVVLGDTIFTTLVPGAAVQLFGTRLRVGADWEMVTKGWGTSAIRAGAQLALPRELGLSFRAEFDGDFKTRTISASLSWHSATTRFTGFGARARQGGADHIGLWGSAIAPQSMQPSGPRFGR